MNIKRKIDINNYIFYKNTNKGEPIQVRKQNCYECSS